MANGHGQRAEDEERLIEAIEKEGWNHYSDPPDWVISAAESDSIHTGVGFKPKKMKYRGDHYVYLTVSSVHGQHIHVFHKRNRNTTRLHQRREHARIARNI